MPVRLDESLIEEHFIRSPGPGGENVNKVATAVELRYDTTRATLTAGTRARLAALAGKKMTGEGVLVIHAHDRRTQLGNRKAARDRLADLLRRASRPPKRRRPTAPPAVARERRLEAKHRRAAAKRRRRRAAPDED